MAVPALMRVPGADGYDAAVDDLAGIQLKLDGRVMNVEALVQHRANLIQDHRAL